MKTIARSKAPTKDEFYLPDVHRSMLDLMFPEPIFATRSIVHLDSTDSSRPLRVGTFVRRQLDAAVAETLLKRFESLQNCFPFVTLPAQWMLDSISQKRPFLTLGILSAMSNTDIALQQRLDLAFRRALSELVIVNNGETTLDILQGLLIYLAW
jgi:hypothetical protein